MSNVTAPSRSVRDAPSKRCWTPNSMTYRMSNKVVHSILILIEQMISSLNSQEQPAQYLPGFKQQNGTIQAHTQSMQEQGLFELKY